MRTDRTRSDDRTEWVRWRAQRLRKAGFPADLAQRLAQEDRLDLHELLELVDRGCPPELAARIIAPIEDQPERA
ncbi:MAG TPA: hypothetical protein VGF91_00105 [Solirubrobacteraceae bacterium]